MKSLFEYDVLVNDVFYRCWHILEYIEKHSDIDKLERDAIQATIMDALVFRVPPFVDTVNPIPLLLFTFPSSSAKDEVSL